jgi:hypothetical protein
MKWAGSGITNGNVLTLNSKPTLNYTDIAYLQQDSFINKILDIYLVRQNTTSGYVKFTGFSPLGIGYDYVAVSGDSSTGLYQNYGTPSLYTNKTLFTGTTRGDVYTTLNGTKIETQANADTTAFTFFRFGWYYVTTFGWQGNCSELIIFNTSTSAIRNNIIDNENSYYAVF